MARIRFGTSYATEATGMIATIPDGSEAWKLERRGKSQGGGVEVHWLIKEVVPQVPPTLTDEQLDQIAEQIEQQRAERRGERAAYEAANGEGAEYAESTYAEIDDARRLVGHQGVQVLDSDVPVAAV